MKMALSRSLGHGERHEGAHDRCTREAQGRHSGGAGWGHSWGHRGGLLHWVQGAACAAGPALGSPGGDEGRSGGGEGRVALVAALALVLLFRLTLLHQGVDRPTGLKLGVVWLEVRVTFGGHSASWFD